MLRKLNIAIDCADDAQKEDVQRVLQDISGMGLLQGGQILAIYPFFKKHQRDIIQLFNLLTKNGPKAILSLEGAALINNLRK
jgi:hypothetical protein